MVKICLPGASGVGSAAKAIRPLVPGKVAQAGDAKSSVATIATPVKTARNLNSFMPFPPAMVASDSSDPSVYFIGRLISLPPLGHECRVRKTLGPGHGWFAPRRHRG